MKLPKICGIYKITNIVNSKCVIGQSVNITRRWAKYRSELKQNKWFNPYLQNAWNKYGEQNFKFEVILECPREKLNEEEIKLIEKYKSSDRNLGYNIEKGGISGKYKAKETREKHSRAITGKKHTEEHNKKISESLKGNQNNLGNTASKETKEKMKISMTGLKRSEEAKRKIGEAKQGVKHPFFNKHLPEETKLKMSEAQKGSSNHFYGKHHSEETKRKITEGNRLYREKKKATQNQPSSLFDNTGNLI